MIGIGEIEMQSTPVGAVATAWRSSRHGQPGRHGLTGFLAQT
jgi:hypothetical protein